MWVVLTPPPPGPFDGISDYAARLAHALDAHMPTRCVVAGQDSLPPASGVEAVCLQYNPSASLAQLTSEIGEWVRVVRAAGAPVIVTVHEYWPPADGTLRRWWHRRAARRQLAAFLTVATAVVVAQEISARELAESGITDLPIEVVPVGSNIAVTASPTARTGGVLVFGQPAAMDPGAMHQVALWLEGQAPGVQLRWVARSAREVHEWWTLRANGNPALLLVHEALPEGEVSGLLRSATLGLAFHADGTSARRTTLAALLTHEVPTIALVGKATDTWITECPALALVSMNELATIPATMDAVLADVARRVAMGAAAAGCAAQHVTWPVIAARYARLLNGRARGLAT